MGEPQLQSAMAIVAFAIFLLVWIGLGANIVKISRRAENPPSFNPVLNAAHLGRFAGWALVGAATLRTDPWTGALLLSTRVPAAALVLVTFLQRRVLRPPPGLLLRTLLPAVGGLVAACVLVALASGPRVELSLLGVALPPASALEYALNGFVLACFAVQILYALPRQIHEARAKPLGNLRWFQLSLAVNYGYTLLYSLVVQDELVRGVMRLSYGAAFALQLVFVLQIERAIRSRRAAP